MNVGSDPTSGNGQIKRRGFLGKLSGLLAGSFSLSLIGQRALADTKGTSGTTQADPLLGEIAMFAGNFAPSGWAFCNGQILSIAQNQALFSLLGTTYGGDGRATFALPDLQGRVPVGAGQGPGLLNITLGEMSGEMTHTLTSPEMPLHSHSSVAASALGTSDSPVGNVLAVNAEGTKQFSPSGSAALNANAIAPSGGSLPHNNMQPYTGISYIIALVGVFPSRP